MGGLISAYRGDIIADKVISLRVIVIGKGKEVSEEILKINREEDKYVNKLAAGVSDLLKEIDKHGLPRLIKEYVGIAFRLWLWLTPSCTWLRVCLFANRTELDQLQEDGLLGNLRFCEIRNHFDKLPYL